MVAFYSLVGTLVWFAVSGLLALSCAVAGGSLDKDGRVLRALGMYLLVIILAANMILAAVHSMLNAIDVVLAVLA